MWKYSLLIAALIIGAPAWSAAEKPTTHVTPPKVMVQLADGTWHQVKDLTDIAHEKVVSFMPGWLLHKNVYVYDLVDSQELYLTYEEIKSIKNKRPFEVNHPVWSFGTKNAGSAGMIGTYLGGGGK